MAKQFGSQLDLQKIPVLNIVVQQASAAPSSPVNGQVYYDTTLNQMRGWVNGSWVQLDNTAGASPGVLVQDEGTNIQGTNVTTVNYVGAGVTATLGGANLATVTISGAPTGSASGDLTGTYPGPSIANLAVTGAKIASRTIAEGNCALSMEGGADANFALRQLGLSAGQAMSGVTRLDQIAAPTAAVSFNGQLQTNVATPVSTTDGATKGYVDSVAQGLDAKPSVRAATTGAITLSAAQTVDGVALVAGDRCLVKNQAGAPSNGVYVVAAGAWTRATDMDASNEFPGAYVFVEEGTVNADTGWVCTADSVNFVYLTSSVNWVQFSGAGTYIGGNGLTLTGTTFDVNVDNSSIEINADILRVKAAGVTNAMLAGSIDLTSKVTGQLPVANGGTGSSSGIGARTNLGAVGKFASTLGALVAGTPTTINHNLNTTDVHAKFLLVTGGHEVILDWNTVDANNIQVTADIAYTTGTVRAVVMG